MSESPESEKDRLLGAFTGVLRKRESTGDRGLSSEN